MSKRSNHPLMSPAMKMADLMDLDFSLLGVATRMGLAFGFGEATVADECGKRGIDPETFLFCRPSTAIGEYALLEKVPQHIVLRH